MGSDEEKSEKTPVDLYDVLGVVLQQIVELSWQKLGLQPDFVTGTLQTDLEQAKVGIDVAGMLAEKIELKLDAEDRRTLQNALRDLRLNYVNRAGGG